MSAISTITAILAALGVGVLGYFLRGVLRPSSFAKREHEIEVAGQRKIDKINKDAAEEHKRVSDDLAKSRSKSASDAIIDLIESGKVSR